MSSISFDNVWVFYLAIPLAVIILVPFILAIRKDNLSWRNIVALALHVVIATLVLFAASGIKTETVLTKTSVYVVADVSYSANRNLDKIDDHISNLKKNLPSNSELGIVCFAKDYELLTALGEDIKSVRQSSVDDSETNISVAVEYAATLFPEDSIKRIVIISDGKSTYASDSLRSVVGNLVSRGIYVDAIYLDDNLGEDVHEVQISRLDVQSTVLKGEFSSVKISIESNLETVFSELNVYKKTENDYELFLRKMINLTAGETSIEMELDTCTEGVFDYKVEIVDVDDTSEFNNTLFFTQEVIPNLKVLVYHGNEMDFEDVSALYSEETVLVGANIFLDNYVPFDIGELCEYDEIVICDVDLSRLPYYEILISNIETVVSSFGKSLVTFGNLGVQSPAGGGDALKTLDDMLPVRFGSPSDLPKMYALVLDTSISMEIFGRMVIAREATKMLLNLMNDDDYVYVGGFSGEVYTLQPPTKVSECREELLQKIERFDFRQGTMIGAALSDTLRKVSNYTSIFSSIQVTLITDGRDYKMESDITPLDAVQKLKAYGIPTSVILTGYDSGTTEDSVISEMNELAFVGGGRLYRIRQESDVSKVILEEYVSAESKTEIYERSFVRVNKPRDPVLEGLDTFKLYVDYYILCTPRARANTILTVDHYYEDSSSLDKNIQVPLYAYWNYGNGRVSTYAGKLNGLKAHKNNTQGAEGANKILFENTIKTATPVIFNDVPFMVSHDLEGKTANITLTPVEVNHTSANNLAEIKVTLPDNSVINANLAFMQDSYVYSFNLTEVGKYMIEYSYQFEGTTYRVTKYFYLSYMPEYNAFEHFDQSALFTAVASTGEVIEEGTLKLDNSNSKVELRTLSLGIYLLIIATVLYIVDIAIRRLKWNDIVSFFFGSSYKQRRVKNDKKK